MSALLLSDCGEAQSRRQAVLSLQMLLKIKEAAAGLEDVEAMAQGDDDDDEGDGKKEEEHPLDDLNVDSSEGLMIITS